MHRVARVIFVAPESHTVAGDSHMLADGQPFSDWKANGVQRAARGALNLRPGTQKILSSPGNRNPTSPIRGDGYQPGITQFLRDRPV